MWSGPERASVSGPFRWFVLTAAFAVALLVRAGAAWLAQDLACHADECWYRELAAALRDGQGVLPARGHLWPPGYVLFLAAAPTPLVARLAQAVLSALTIVPLVLVARRCFGERAALGAAWLFALCPTLIAFSHGFWPEALYVLALSSAAACTVSLCGRLRTGAPAQAIAAGAGIAFGLACLTKSIALFFVPLVLLWIVAAASDRRRAAAAAFVVALATSAIVLPWSLYASARYQRFVIAEATLGLNLWRGNNVFLPFDADWGLDRPMVGGYPPCDEPNPVDLDRCNTRRALRFIAERPLLFLERIPTKMADLWTPSSFLIRHLRLGLYGSIPAPLVETLVGLDVVWWVVLAVGGMVGLALPVPRGGGHDDARAFRSFLLLLLGYTCAVHAATFGMSRFRLPLYPFLAIFAARAWVERARLVEISRRPTSILVTAAAVAALIAMWLNRFGSVWPRRSA